MTMRVPTPAPQRGGAARKLLSSLVAMGAAAIAAPALAADLPFKAPPAPAPLMADWTGFYVGLGVGFRSTDTRVDVVSATQSPPGVTGSDLLVGCKIFSNCVFGEPLNGVAARLSPYGGYNWQIARWVVGAEADFGFADQTKTLGGVIYPFSGVFFSGHVRDSFALRAGPDASVRGRVGFLVTPTVMVYGTAGPAWLRVESTSTCSTATTPEGNCRPTLFSPAVIADQTTKLGVTVGGGLEAMIWSNWLLRGEYRYADFGTIDNTDVRTCATCVAGNTQTVAYEVKVKTHTATFGLAYKFGDPSASVAPISAFARADVAPVAFSWTGFYVGAGAGARASQIDGRTTSFVTTDLATGVSDAAATCAFCAFGGVPVDHTSFRFAPFAGFNWQFAPRVVGGIEADFGFADRTTTLGGFAFPGLPFVNFGTSANDTFSVRTAWDASVRGRLGYLVEPSVLLYATGGVTFMKIEQTDVCGTGSGVFPTGTITFSTVSNCTPGLFSPSAFSHTVTKAGFTVGGGGETRLWSNWFARAEYRYADYGKFSSVDVRTCPGGFVSLSPTSQVSCGTPPGETRSVGTELLLRTHTAMFGLAYKFDWGGPVVAKY